MDYIDTIPIVPANFCVNRYRVNRFPIYARQRHIPEPYDWANRFEVASTRLMLANICAPLIQYETLGRDAALSIPTLEHYLPLLYILGARRNGETVGFPVEGVGTADRFLCSQCRSVKRGHHRPFS
jgi:aromatic ring-opening dioxygenase catalytic subunit (LigB family)